MGLVVLAAAQVALASARRASTGAGWQSPSPAPENFCGRSVAAAVSERKTFFSPQPLEVPVATAQPDLLVATCRSMATIWNSPALPSAQNSPGRRQPLLPPFRCEEWLRSARACATPGRAALSRSALATGACGAEVIANLDRTPPTRCPAASSRGTKAGASDCSLLDPQSDARFEGSILARRPSDTATRTSLDRTTRSHPPTPLRSATQG